MYTQMNLPEKSVILRCQLVVNISKTLGEIQERRRAERMERSNGINIIEVNKQKIHELKPEIKLENMLLRKVFAYYYLMWS